jgi:hypothetical protein
MRLSPFRISPLQLPDELISSIGGSTGVKAAVKAVQAIVRMGAMAKMAKKEGGAA